MSLPFVPAPNACKVELRFTQQAQKVENVFHVHGIAPMVAADLVNIADIFVNWYRVYLGPDVSNTVTLDSVVATALDSSTAPGVVYGGGLPITGGNAGAALPMNATVAVKWGTGVRGRNNRGRTYHIGLTETQVTGSTLLATPQSLLITDYAGIITTLSAASWHLSVVSYWLNKVRRSSAQITPITTISIDNTLDSQRRRLPGRGR